MGKIIEAQVTNSPWEDVKGVTHLETNQKLGLIQQVRHVSPATGVPS
jgi:hypothetical protein